MLIAALQINPIVGAVAENFKKIDTLIRQRVQNGKEKIDLFVCPELTLIGYPPKDLLSLEALLNEEASYLQKTRQLSLELGVGILLGHTAKNESGLGKPLFNCATLFDRGETLITVKKTRLPEYDIFEESRFFEPSPASQPPVLFREHLIGISICEDSWDTVLAFGRQDVRRYPSLTNPVHGHKEATIEINLSASPFVIGKNETRIDLIRAAALRNQKTFVYCSCVGAQDDIIFDGGSFVVSPSGDLLGQAPRFIEHVLTVDLATDPQNIKTPEDSPEERYSEILQALTLGIQDYVRKNNFKSVILGLSGGIDSALCAYLATKALGPQNVDVVYLPSQFSSNQSRSLSLALCKNLGLQLKEINIDSTVESFRSHLNLTNTGLPFENLQSRVRGTFLMALSNSLGHLLITTGNKSELAMGYGTLYGDMCGGLNPIGDLFKTEVFALSHFINTTALKNNLPGPIPNEIILRVPSAELAPEQKDSDSLPPYEILDMILEDIIENNGKMKFKRYDSLLGPRHSLESIQRKLQLQEFKRYQSPPILKVKARSFGSGWHMPLTKGVI